MVEAVEYVHQMGYVHRNIACHHFLIDYNDVIKLCDFSLAQTSREARKFFHNLDEIGNIGVSGFTT